MRARLVVVPACAVHTWLGLGGWVVWQRHAQGQCRIMRLALADAVCMRTVVPVVWQRHAQGQCRIMQLVLADTVCMRTVVPDWAQRHRHYLGCYLGSD